ncbi:MAG: glycosyltransferase family 9 protein [Pseudomonadota bacterium]
MGSGERICILRLSAIGDCVHTLAVVRAIRDALPECQLTWLIGKTEATLMQGLEGVELVVVDKQADRTARTHLAHTLRSREFDVLLNMHASWRANLISRLIRAPRKVGFDRGRARDAQWLFTNERIPPQHHPHVLDGLFEFASHIGVARSAPRWELPLADADYALADQLVLANRPLVVISPCSSQRAKNFRNWPAERFAAITQLAVARYSAIVAVTGGGSALEHEYAEAIKAAAPESVYDLVGKSSLKSLAALIRRADCVICPDSGPAHIASAVGTPAIGLYATSNPGRTGPVAQPEFTVDRYPDALKKYMDETVESVRWGQRVRHPDAMALITVEEVAEKLDQALRTQAA